MRKFIAVICAAALLSVASVSPVKADATSDALQAILAKLNGIESRLDKVERVQASAPSDVAINAARAASARRAAPVNAVSTDAALGQTRGQCASGRCGQN